MADMDGVLFEALSTLEMAELEDQNGGDRYAIRRAARAALELAQGAGGQKPLRGEIIGRANQLLEG